MEIDTHAVTSTGYRFSRSIWADDILMNDDPQSDVAGEEKKMNESLVQKVGRKQ